MTKKSDLSESQHPGSFRDPAGFIFVLDKTVYRQVNKVSAKDYDQLMSSGLYQKLVDANMMVAHSEVSIDFAQQKQIAHKVIKPSTIPFISYPYEWSFSQLKDASLLTLRIQKLALSFGMTLKDASAYNIQFVGKRPVFIDTLSFTTYETGAPWAGYKQFCEHFLGPLALASNSSSAIIPTLRTMIDGMPLELSTSLLPLKTHLKWGLKSHLFIHKSSQNRHKNTETTDIKPRKVSQFALSGLISSLESTIRKLNTPKSKTEWGEYYSFTNYSNKSFKSKKNLVEDFIKLAKPKCVWDLGGNTGEFSQIPASLGIYTVCFDIDPNAVEQNYLREDGKNNEFILPLFQDLTNPSPALGWAHEERSSLSERGPVDLAMALALVHHLAIGNNLPLTKIAKFFSSISKFLIIEFVPKEDSKVKILLKSRPDIFPDYTVAGFETAMSKYFSLVKSDKVPGSKRTIYLYKSK